MAHFLPSGYKILLNITCVAVQFVSEPENCQGILNFNCEQMRVLGCKNHYKAVLGAGVKAKSVTIQLTYIDRVTVAFIYYF